MLDRIDRWAGCVVGVVGTTRHRQEPRLAREAATLAAGRGVEVFSTVLRIPHHAIFRFSVVARLLRASVRRGDLDGEAARARVRARVPDADPEDLLLLDDLLGIADPETPPPQIDPDARRRRLTALVNTAVAGPHPTGAVCH